MKFNPLQLLFKSINTLIKSNNMVTIRLTINKKNKLIIFLNDLNDNQANNNQIKYINPNLDERKAYDD